MNIVIFFITLNIIIVEAFVFNIKKSIKQYAELDNLIALVNSKQSYENKVKVEKEIKRLSSLADSNPTLLKKSIEPKSWRTIWTSVTANTLIGSSIGNKPSNVLGGLSWQVFSKNMNSVENIVYWKALQLRMVGIADIELIDNNKGYNLYIKGLEFRWGLNNNNNNIPESIGIIGNEAVQKDKNGNNLVLIKLNDNKTLRNGVGKLDLLYNNGFLRITCDQSKQLAYIHLAEDNIDFLNK